jgi:hypothetical protein
MGIQHLRHDRRLLAQERNVTERKASHLLQANSWVLGSRDYNLVMADFGGIGIALSGLKTMLDLSKNVHDGHIARKISEEVANIQGQLIDVQQQALQIQQANQNLQRELDVIRSYKQHDSVIWRQNPDGSEEGPFCPVCISDSRETRLLINPDYPPNPDFFSLYCPKAHHESPHRLSKAPGPYFNVPKNLIPENYFFPPTPRNPKAL